MLIVSWRVLSVSYRWACSMHMVSSTILRGIPTPLTLDPPQPSPTLSTNKRPHQSRAPIHAECKVCLFLFKVSLKVSPRAGVRGLLFGLVGDIITIIAEITISWLPIWNHSFVMWPSAEGSVQVNRHLVWYKRSLFFSISASPKIASLLPPFIGVPSKKTQRELGPSEFQREILEDIKFWEFTACFLIASGNQWEVAKFQWRARHFGKRNCDLWDSMVWPWFHRTYNVDIRANFLNYETEN